MDANQQVRMQLMLKKICEKLACQVLYVPTAWRDTERQYTMEEIDVNHPILLQDVAAYPGLCQELAQVHASCRRRRVFPADFELFLQPTGRVAMLDFDKFGTWHPDGAVTFPWHTMLTAFQVTHYLNGLLGGRSHAGQENVALQKANKCISEEVKKQG